MKNNKCFLVLFVFQLDKDVKDWDRLKCLLYNLQPLPSPLQLKPGVLPHLFKNATQQRFQQSKSHLKDKETCCSSIGKVVTISNIKNDQIVNKNSDVQDSDPCNQVCLLPFIAE